MNMGDKSDEKMYAALNLLDRQLLDDENVPCGKVDDLELTFVVANDPKAVEPVVTGIYTSPGALADRLPRGIGPVIRNVWKILRPDEDPQPVRIPWAAVKTLDSAIHLSVNRQKAGLMRSEDWVRTNIIDRIPGLHEGE